MVVYGKQIELQNPFFHTGKLPGGQLQRLCDFPITAAALLHGKHSLHGGIDPLHFFQKPGAMGFWPEVSRDQLLQPELTGIFQEHHSFLDPGIL